MYISDTHTHIYIIYTHILYIYIYTYIRTCIYIYIHTYICKHPPMGSLLFTTWSTWKLKHLQLAMQISMVWVDMQTQYGSIWPPNTISSNVKPGFLFRGNIGGINVNGGIQYGYGSIPIDTFLVGWTSIYQLFWGSLGTRVLTHPHIETLNGGYSTFGVGTPLFKLHRRS